MKLKSYSKSATLSPITMEVENVYVWKVTTIGGTHFSLPWIREEVYLLTVKWVCFHHPSGKKNTEELQNKSLGKEIWISIKRAPRWPSQAEASTLQDLEVYSCWEMDKWYTNPKTSCKFTPEKMNARRRSLPFGSRPVFRGELAFSFKEGILVSRNKYVTSYPWASRNPVANGCFKSEIIQHDEYLTTRLSLTDIYITPSFNKHKR